MQRLARLTCVLFAVVTLGASRATAGGLLPATPMLPPMIVTVVATSDVPSSLVELTLAEAAAIWRRAGCAFVWRHGDANLGSSAPPPPSSSLRVVIGSQQRRPSDGSLPLGWIVFDDIATPEQEIYVSYASALQFLEVSAPVVGRTAQMPERQRELLLSRALGRALAHELGHYLLASKVHARSGLMKATQTATALFSPDPSPSFIAPAQSRVAMARLAVLQLPMAEVTPRYRGGA